MAVNTWVGGASGNETAFAIDANWNTTDETNRVPTAADDVIIPDTSSGHKCVLDQARNINSFVLAPDGEFDQGNAFYIKGKNAAGEAVKCQGKLGDVSDFVIETQSAATATLTKQSGSGSFRNLTITHASGDITFTASVNLSGNLTITQGKLRCNGATVEVTGATTVGDGSASADTATLQCDASAMFLGINKTDGYALEIKRGGTYNGGTGNHQSGAVKVTTDSNADAKLDFTNANHTIKSEYTSQDRFFELTSGTVTHSNGTIILDSAVTSAIQWLGPAGDAGPYDLKLDDTGMTVKPRNTLTVLHDMTILAGTFNTQYDGSDKNLIVNGDVSITGTLTGNTSAITIGKMLEITNGGTYNETSGTTLISGQPDGDYVLRNHDGGTYTKHATGILKIARTSASGTKYAKFGEDVYNDVKLENSASGSVVAIVGVMNLAGDLTVVEGELRSYGGTGAIDVDGDVSIEDGGKFSTETSQLAAGGVNADFGSLTIASGGTYDATPLTTTITGGNSSTGYSFNNSGTFTHNKGKIKVAFTPSQNWYSQCNEYYDLELAYTENWNLYLTDQSGGAITILGDLTITHGMLEVYTSADSLTVHGLTTNKGTFENAANQDTNKITHHGLVTNTGNYRINDGTTVKMNGGIRNMGTITVA